MPGAGCRKGDVRMILATTKVKDVDHWLSVYTTTSAAKRAEHGSTGSTVFRDPSDEHRVWVLFDWDEEGLTNFMSDPEVPPILQEAGHVEKATAATLIVTYGS
jgi:hypothetical protein